MAIRTVVQIGDETLRKKARPVETLNRRILTLLDDMADTMYEQNGAGLAAPQVGVLRRAIVIDVGDDNGLIQLINPEIIECSGEQENAEGCLSVPGRRGYVIRPQRIVVRGINRGGKTVDIEAEGYLAVAFSHEIDHLDGILYVDKMTREMTEEEMLAASEEQKQDGGED